MKKLLTFLTLACAFLAGNAQGTEQIFCINYAQLAYSYVESGKNIPYERVTSSVISFDGTNTWKFNFTQDSETIISTNDSITASKPGSNNVSLRYYNNNNLGLYCGATSTDTYFGLLGFQKGDVVEIGYTQNYQISPITNLTYPSALGQKTLTLSKEGFENLNLNVNSFTMTILQDGNACFSLKGSYIAYVKVTRPSLTPSYGSFILNGKTDGVPQSTPSENSNESFEISDNGTSLITITPQNSQIYNYGNSDIGNRGFNFNGTDYPPILLRNTGDKTFTYTANENVTKILIYGRANSATANVNVTVSNVNTSESQTLTFNPYSTNTNTQEVVSYDITNYNKITSNSGLLFVLVIEYGEKYTVTVGDINAFEWNKNLASGDWGNSDNPFSNIISVSYQGISGESNETISLEDLGLSVMISPEFTTQTQPTVWSESVGMPNWLWNQMVGIQNSDQEVDGYYVRPATGPSIEASTSSNNSFDITNFIIPCSGQYTMYLISNKSNVEILNGSQTINVYPSTNLTYSEYTITGNGEEDIVIKSDELQLVRTSEDANTAILYIPGVYCLDGAYYSWDPDATAPDNVQDNPGELQVKRKVEVPSAYKAIDMESWNIDIPSTTSQSSLFLILSKNNVSTPLVGNTNKSESQIVITSIPTAVEAVEAVDGPAEYFNLQGVKIANPDHGIFIKVQNGKASKVIL